MSKSNHSSNRPLFAVLIFILIDLSVVKSQRAFLNKKSHNTILNEHHLDNDHLSVRKNPYNDLEKLEPLWYEETEFDEQNSNLHDTLFKNVLHATQLNSGLTIIPTIERSNLNNQYHLQNFYLTALLPIHKKKLNYNLTEICSEEINSPAIYDLEAILWTLDQINLLIANKNGLNFNLAVLDTCSSPNILSKLLNNLLSETPKHLKDEEYEIPLPFFSSDNLISFVSSVSPPEFKVAHDLLSPFNVSLISAQDISFLNQKLGFSKNVIQTALPLEYFTLAALQHLKNQKKKKFSVLYSNSSMQSSMMLDTLVKWITLENKKSKKLIDTKELDKKQNFCMQSVINVPSDKKLSTGEASQILIQLQNENKNIENSADDNIVLVLTESHTTRELLIAYKHLLNAGILKQLSFILIKESNLNIVSGIESSMINMLVLRESQKSLKDFVEYFEQLKPENNLRNPFFKQYWLQSVNCGQNRDCLFDQIDPINTVNIIQSTFALSKAFLKLKNEICAQKDKLEAGENFEAICNSFNESLVKSEEKKTNSHNYIKTHLLSQLVKDELELSQLSKHFNHIIKFTEHAFPEKSVDVLKFRIVNQAYRFDRVANYLNGDIVEQLKNIDSKTFSVNYKLLTCHQTYSYQSSSLKIDQKNSLKKIIPITFWSKSWWWHWWWRIAAIVNLIGALSVFVCALYFLFTFDYNVGTTILGYMILFGIFLLYIVNFFFIFPFNFVVCWVRCYLMSISYSTILSAMLVKVMNNWRIHTYNNYNDLYIQHLNIVGGNNIINNNENIFQNQNSNNFLNKKLNSLSTLMSMCLGLISLGMLSNLVWLIIYPPRAQQLIIENIQQWKCYNTQFAVLIETDSIFSILFSVMLILITMFFSVLTWKYSTINSYESRWIMFSCYVIVVTWIIWAFLFKMFHLVELRDLFVVIANLLVSTSILICMFLRKLIIFYKLKKSKKQNKTHQNLVNSTTSSFSTYYGSVTKSKSQSIINKNNSQNDQDNFDNVSTISAITTTSSIISSVKNYFTKKNSFDYNNETDFHLSSISDQSIATKNKTNKQQVITNELYPMDVYEAGSRQSNEQTSQQPDSLFFTEKKNIFSSNHSLYLIEEKDYI
uniref:Metabotropic glutamate receptor-like protein n=1 Tax=Polyphagotarsonemus latus TaxID=1204166 RepID=A0AAN0LPL5_9ACAR